MDSNLNFTTNTKQECDDFKGNLCPICHKVELFLYYDETEWCPACNYHQGISRKEFWCPSCGSKKLQHDNNLVICSDCGCTVKFDFTKIEKKENMLDYYNLVHVTKAELLPGPKQLNNAFSEFTELKEMILPDGIEIIHADAFSNCLNLQTIHLPATIQVMETNVFSGCQFREIELPKGITQIDAFSFCDCSELSHITIPEGVESIGTAAFQYCTSLHEITIPSSVKRIMNHAFHGCTSLTKVRLLNKECFVDPSAFSDCPNVKIV